MSPTVSRILFGMALLFLLTLAWIGLSGAVDQFPRARTIGQQLQTVAQLAYGVSSLLNIVVLFSARQWSRAVSVCFVLSVAAAGGLAPVVWGDQSVTVGFLSGIVSLLIAWGIIWLLRTGTRHASPVEPG